MSTWVSLVTLEGTVVSCSNDCLDVAVVGLFFRVFVAERGRQLRVVLVCAWYKVVSLSFPLNCKAINFMDVFLKTSV